MAQWIPDPQGRQEVEKVSKNLKLPVWQAWYKGKFRDFWNEVWGKIDDYCESLKTLADGKVSKTGDTMTGQLEIKINPQNTADFLYLYRNNDKIASLGGGADDFFIHNSVANTTLQLKNNGYAFYPALNLKTISKEVVGAVNEVNSIKQNKQDNALITIDKTVTGAINENKKIENAIAGGQTNYKFIQDSGTKTKGQFYVDKVNGKLYLCISTTSTTTNSTTYFKDVSLNNLSNEIEGIISYKKSSLNDRDLTSIKFSNGVMIQTATLRHNFTQETLYYTLYFLENFSDVSYSVSISSYERTNSFPVLDIAPQGTNNILIHCSKPSNFSFGEAKQYGIRIIAIGTWK